jgi:hypothetical protein
VDVTNGDEPKPLGTIDLEEAGAALGVDVLGSRAFVVFSSGLAVVDVSDARRPKFVGKFPSQVRGGVRTGSVRVVEGIAYVADGEAGLMILDVRTPEQLVLIGSYPSGGAACGGVEIDGQTAYVAHEDGLDIVDVSSPAMPVLLGRYRASVGLSAWVRAAQGHAYLFGDSKSWILDVSSPSSPYSYTWHYVAGSGGRDVFVSDGMAFFASTVPGMVVMDFTQPFTSTEVSATQTAGLAWGIDVVARRAYLATGQGLEIVDVANGAQPVPLGRLRTDSFALGVTAIGSVAYVADGDGLKVLDVADAGSPKLLGAAGTRGRACATKVRGSLCYVASQHWGIEIFDVSNPANPRARGNLQCTDGYPASVDASTTGTWLALAHSGGLQIIDVSEPTLPVRRGSIATGGWATSVQLAGQLAYVADVNVGLAIIDVSDLDRPVRVGGVAAESAMLSLRLMEGKVCVGEGRGLKIFDRSNPTVPRLLGSFDTGLIGVYGIEVFKDRAYVSGGDGGLSVIDLADPTQMRLLASYDSPGWASSACLDGDQVILADGEWGVELLRFIEPPRLRVVAHTPDGLELDVPLSATSATVLQSSPDLLHWLGILTNAPGSGSVMWRDPMSFGEPRRFYRLVN